MELDPEMTDEERQMMRALYEGIAELDILALIDAAHEMEFGRTLDDIEDLPETEHPLGLE